MSQSDVSPIERGLFRHRWKAAFPVSFSMGVIDTYSFDRYQAFTTNQAGNLVLVANEAQSRSQSWRLALASLLGAAVGAVLSTWIRGRFKHSLQLQVGLPVVIGAALLAAIGVASIFLQGSSGLEVVGMAVAVAMIAAAIVATPAVPGWITADTGNLLTAVTAPVTGSTSADGTSKWTPAARSALLIVTGFVCGALFYTFVLEGSRWALIVGLAPAVITVLAELVPGQRKPS